jgi:hypothetical protein
MVSLYVGGGTDVLEKAGLMLEFKEVDRGMGI